MMLLCGLLESSKTSVQLQWSSSVPWGVFPSGQPCLTSSLFFFPLFPVGSYADRHSRVGLGLVHDDNFSHAFVWLVSSLIVGCLAFQKTSPNTVRC